jgi:RNA polymerase sigma factor for flagellar operon FliA
MITPQPVKKYVPASELWALKEQGCPEARETLIQIAYPLVTKTRARIVPNVPQLIEVEDLEAEGYQALVKSVDSFNPRRGVLFTTYAITRIRGAMLEHLRREDWVPRSVRTKQKTVLKTRQEVTLKTSNPKPSSAECAAHLGVTLDEWLELEATADITRRMSIDDVYLDGEEDEEKNHPAEHYGRLDDERVRVEEDVIGQISDMRLWKCVARLSPQQRQVVYLHYRGGLTFAQIAQKIGRSHSRVGQLHAAALKILRESLTGETVS